MPTTVLLDGSPLTCRESTLAGAIEAGRAAAGNRLIVEVRVDGNLVNPHEVIAGYGTVQRIEMVSADPGALARCTLHDAADALEAIASVQADAAGLLQTGDTDRAMGLLDRVRETWGAVVQTVEVIRTSGLLGTEGDSVVGNLAAAGNQAKLNTCLRTMIDALGAKDDAALADILAYDLRQLAEEWIASLRAGADACPQGSGRAGSPA